MQELRSTEILDKEILNDAAKKAENIKRKTDEEISQVLASVDENVAIAEKDKKAYYAEKLNSFIKDKKAAAPLEKQRMEVSFIQKSIMLKINKYLSSLSEKKRLELVLKQIPAEFIKQNKNLIAYIYGFDFEAAKKALAKEYKSEIKDYKQTDFCKLVPEEAYSLDKENLKGIILETEDKNYRYRLTTSEVLGIVLDKNRAELAQSLFGADFSADFGGSN